MKKLWDIESMIWFTEEDLERHDQSIRQKTAEQVINDIPEILSVEVGFSVTKKNLVNQLKEKYLNN